MDPDYIAMLEAEAEAGGTISLEELEAELEL